MSDLMLPLRRCEKPPHNDASCGCGCKCCLPRETAWKARIHELEAERDIADGLLRESDLLLNAAKRNLAQAEAKRDAAKEVLTRSWTDRTIKIANGIAKERNAIREKTIADVMQVLAKFGFDEANGTLLAAIRALAEPAKEQTK
jgi:hypothetical protein